MNALDGTVVLDLTRLLPGPLATLQLADHGAEVIKIEDIGKGDYARREMAFGISMSHLFHALNRGKKSAAIDLRADAGREAFLKLVATADVVVESFRPGVLDRLGIGYDQLKEVKNDIILCSITAYGQTGPYRDQAGHDINMCGYAGVSDQLGFENGAPAPSNFQIGDIAGGSLTATTAILMALLKRDRTQDGAHIDVSITDSLFAYNLLPFTNAQLFQKSPERGADILTGGLGCYGYYETSDGGYMAVGALEPKFWQAFCRKLDREDLIEEHLKFGDEAASLKQTLKEVFKTRTRDEWAAFLGDADCCITPVLTPLEAQNDPQIKSRGLLYTSEDPVDGEMLRLVNPIRMNGAAPAPAAPAPRLGEHTDEILGQAGYDGKGIAALYETGVVKSEQP
ncbi:MAG: CaiB/BaiF CoA-transferase family protein [Pseudomonadota bacterium]